MPGLRSFHVLRFVYNGDLIDGDKRGSVDDDISLKIPGFLITKYNGNSAIMPKSVCCELYHPCEFHCRIIFYRGFGNIPEKLWFGDFSTVTVLIFC